MSSNLKITVLIDNYNYGQFVGQAIDSALAQTYPHLEVVVVDDGSTDDSQNVIRSYGDRICAVFKENGGQASAFNVGFAHASGDIIMLLDADDFLHVDAAAQIVSAWKPDTGVLYHRLRTVNILGQELGYQPDLSITLDSGDVLPLLLEGRGRYSFPATSGQAYLRKTLEAVLPIPESEFRLCADSYLASTVPFFSPISVMDKPLAYYRIHSSNAYITKTELRRHITRKKLQMRLNYGNATRKAVIDMATKRNLAIPNLASFPSSNDLFDALLIDLSAPVQISLWERITRTWEILKKLSTERSRSPGKRSYEAMVQIFVCFAPRFILTRIYTRLFNA